MILKPSKEHRSFAINFLVSAIVMSVIALMIVMSNNNNPSLIHSDELSDGALQQESLIIELKKTHCHLSKEKALKSTASYCSEKCSKINAIGSK
mmetsp:Transcript_12038/g.17993  ORF Transcript_12038/g.17993 Transcript_12038/m.17993 type:complete len:94 (+) Transcript_12038:456-737(+)